MSIGRYTYGTPEVRFSSEYAKLTIGSFCSIAEHVVIYLGGEHRTDYISTYPFGYLHKNIFNLDREYGRKITKGDVVIGNDVWIGGDATIMSGVTIGDGAVIGNNSHVVKNVEPYAIVGGNPARLIRYRFTPEQIAKLLEIKWWFWEDEKINRYVEMIHDTDIDAFIQRALAESSP